MSYAPAAISAVAAYWVAHGGLNGGIIRSIARQVKPSYHAAKDGIDYYGRTAANDYTIRNVRDRAGLTNAAAALDLSWALANKAGLQAFSNWLIAEVRAGRPDTLDIVELVWSPDGTAISGWHRWRGNDIIPNYGDTSHRWHTHIAWVRDTQANDKLAVFRRYFEPAQEADMPFPVTSYVPGYLATVADPTGPANIRVAPAPTAAIIRAIPRGSSESWTVLGFVKGAYSAFGNSDQWLVRWNVDKWEYTAKGNVAAGPAAPPPPPDTTPYDQEDIDAAIAADRARARVTWDV